MIHSPPADQPVIQEARPRIAGGSKIRNPNYVRISNSYTNGSGLVRRREANHLVKQGRAEWCGSGQVRLNGHPANQAGRRAAAHGYEAVGDGFEWAPGRSDGATVMKTRRSDPQGGKQMSSQVT